MFRFTIRDLLWLMVVVGVSLGWWNEHRRFSAYYEFVVSNIKWSPAGPGAGPVKGAQRSDLDPAQATE